MKQVGITWMAVAVAVLSGFPASAQQDPFTPDSLNADSLAADSLPPDSAQMINTAKDRQAQFEFVRRRLMPTTFMRGGAGCAERIGRFCHWDDEDSDWTPPPDDDQVVDRRLELLGYLDSLATVLPGDHWIAGLRVHYRIEAGLPEQALSAAHECRAEHWWCLALEGYVLHRQGRYEDALETYTEALASMPFGQRCEWQSVIESLDDNLQREYREIPCTQRSQMHAAIWDLADPLYVAAGNDRLTEQLARRTVIEVMKNGANPFGMNWAADIEEIVMRYGWPVGWERSTAPNLEDVISSRDRAYSRSFFPPTGVLMQEPGAEWLIKRNRARTLYLSAFLRRMVGLEHQIAMFRRGDTALVAASYNAIDSIPDGGPIRAGLTIMRPGAGNRQTFNPDAGLENSFLGFEVDSAVIVSLEVFSPIDSIAARVREPRGRPVVAPGGIGISDILLFTPREPLPESVEEAVFLARTTNRVVSNDPLGLYWEVYGDLSGAGSVETEVSVIKEGRGLFRGLFEAVGIARPRKPEVQYEWASAAGETTAVYPRSIVVDLSDADPGRYIVRVVAQRGAEQAVVAERRIEITEP